MHTQAKLRILESTLAARTIATFHPSAVLRATANGGDEDIFEMMVQDLRLAVQAASEHYALRNSAV